MERCEKELEVSENNLVEKRGDDLGLSFSMFCQSREEGGRAGEGIEEYAGVVGRWWIDDPPERASRIRSQVLERYHNELIEGEYEIQQRRKEIQQKINQAVKEVEREYQKRRRHIEKAFARESQQLKQELLDVCSITLAYGHEE